MLIDFHTHKNYTDSTIFIRSYMIGQTPDINHFFTIGLHPWQVQDFDIHEALKIIENLCTQPNCLAIGEIGLDKARQNFDLQYKTFIAQILLAEKIRKPIVIHAVRTYNEIIALRKKYSKTPWAIHGFIGNKQTAFQLIDKNIYLSFGKKLINPPAKLEQAFIAVPYDKIFFETDTWQAHVRQIYIAAGKLAGFDFKTQIQKNFEQFFNRQIT